MRRVCFTCLVGLLMLTPTLKSDVLPDRSGRQSGKVTGHIYDAVTQMPIPRVTIQVEGTGWSTVSNDQGEFRLVLPWGDYRLKATHIGYFSETRDVTVGGTPTAHEIRLQPTLIEIKGLRVYEKAYDPAQRIIVEAIRRKKDILSKLSDYSFDAYTKLVVHKETSPDSAEMFLIAESQTSGFWEQPGKYTEVITARRQSSNLPPEANLMSVGEILNFNKNRIEIGQYSVVSPTARDALDHYNYYLLDTVAIDSQRVFVLEVEPKRRSDPLFTGTIQIADSTYDVVAVDFGFNEAVRLPMIRDGRYRQILAQFEGEYWMPVEIGFSGTADLKAMGMIMTFDYVASLYSYQFEMGHPEGTFGEYELVVEPRADNYDSTAWEARQTIPLTTQEVAGYARIDSIKNAPRPIHKQAARLLLGSTFLLIVPNPVFHFNRVEGPYLGYGVYLPRTIRDTRLWAYGGYAFDAERWQYRVGLRRHVWDDVKLWVGGEVKDQITWRSPVHDGGGIAPSFSALVRKIDPRDYYRERGFRIAAGLKPVDHTRLRLGYNDYRQESAVVATDFGLSGGDDRPRFNPAIADGRLRSVSAMFRYDSRKMWNDRGVESLAPRTVYTRLEAGVTHASPDFIDNDFDFTRYFASLRRRQRTAGLGLTTLDVFWSEADGDVPPQEQFVVDHFTGWSLGAFGFRTTGESNFYGDRVTSVYLRHNFRQKLFAASGLPLIKNLPFDLGVHGGVFWTDFADGPAFAADEFARTARGGYSEIGFSLFNLTPFMNPFNFGASFTWQLTDYDTNDFSFHIELGMPMMQSGSDW